ncbi:MAG: hypothetical protein JSS32_00155 [Verrucomicrobia bacterium]|nr:hypothetical protein [Verrucomicrobiota bacterium]
MTFQPTSIFTVNSPMTAENFEAALVRHYGNRAIDDLNTTNNQNYLSFKNTGNLQNNYIPTDILNRVSFSVYRALQNSSNLAPPAPQQPACEETQEEQLTDRDKLEYLTKFTTQAHTIYNDKSLLAAMKFPPRSQWPDFNTMHRAMQGFSRQ